MTTYTFPTNTAKPRLTFSTADSNNTISMYYGDEEMLKIEPSGFWVRGQLVKQDDQEAEIVYNSFKQWLVMSTLTQP
jgi:hypothetical protein